MRVWRPTASGETATPAALAAVHPPSSSLARLPPLLVHRSGLPAIAGVLSAPSLWTPAVQAAHARALYTTAAWPWTLLHVCVVCVLQPARRHSIAVCSTAAWSRVCARMHAAGAWAHLHPASTVSMRVCAEGCGCHKCLPQPPSQPQLTGMRARAPACVVRATGELPGVSARELLPSAGGAGRYRARGVRHLQGVCVCVLGMLLLKFGVVHHPPALMSLRAWFELRVAWLSCVD